MNLLATLIGWIPRVLLYALAGAVQVALNGVRVDARVGDAFAPVAKASPISTATPKRRAP